MKGLLVALLAAVFCVSGCSTVPAAAPAPAQVVSVAELQSKTVALVEQEDDTVRAFCSGVWVGAHTILTANHCVADTELGEVVNYVVKDDVFSGVNELPKVVARTSRLVMVDPDHDLAVLRALFVPAHDTARLSVSGVTQGQRVLTMGAPLGNMYSFSSGEVGAIRFVESHGHTILFVQATAPISGGNSGGGLFNEYGELVGVCHATFPRGQNLNLWIHYKYAEELLRGKIL